MKNHGKKYEQAIKLVDKSKVYPLTEAIELAKKLAYAKFTGSLDLAVVTSANPKYNDQMLRSTTVLPHGTGKKIRIAVFVGDERQQQVKAAGADRVGFDDLLNDIKNERFDFDVLITAPELIRDLAPVAKALGPKGLMPSPKAGTVNSNLVAAVEEFKKGKIEFRLDKTGNIHASVGKLNFESQELEENIRHLIKAIEENKPTGVKGNLIKKIVISPSMGPSVQISL